MNVGAWLRARDPAPPALLMTRILVALGTDATREAGSADAACLDAATRLLKPLLEAERSGRESALDLLAADALVTYAFEAAAESVDDLEGKTANAMLRLAALAGADGRAVA